MKQNSRNKHSNNKNVRREQPKKDSNSKRINEDNARISKVKKDIEKDEKKVNANDVSWYSKSPETLKAAASIPFASMLGGKLYNDYSIPGIMVLPWTPAVGGESLIPINQAFDSMFSYIVHANSRNYNYNSVDLGLLCIAGANVFSAITNLARVYGVAKYYQERNLYVPEALVKALGFDPTDLRANLGNLWFSINNLIDQTRQIWIPNTMPIFDRWTWLNSNVYTDAPGVASQIYLFAQDLYFIYSETSVETGGVLLPVTLEDDHITGSPYRPVNTIYPVSQHVNVIQSMIDALIKSEDRGMIFGDILNAYGADRIRALSPIPSDYIITPQYNTEVLMQVENWYATDKQITAIGQYDNRIVVGWSNNAMHDENSVIRSNANKVVLNFHFPEQPTPEQVMVASRMIAGNLVQNTASSGADVNKLDISKTPYTWVQGKMAWPMTYGSELPHSPYLYKMWYPDQGYPTIGKVLVDQWNNWTDDNPTGINPAWLDFMAFDWHPFVYVTGLDLILNETTGVISQNAFSVNQKGVYGDFDNYTLLDWEVLRKLHRTALFSLWGVPHI